jgi:hypothetical protein
MRLSQRLIAATVLTAIAIALGGCSSGSFDPTDLMDVFDTKKKLPGERKPVFPEGVPGVEQGVPKELYKGAQEQPPEQAAPVVEAPPPVHHQPKAKAKRAAKPVAPAAESDEAPPAPKPKRKRITAPPPDDAAAPAQPQPQQAAPPPQQQQMAPFPAPLPSGSFSR